MIGPILVIGLAAWRLGFCLVNERGPFGLVHRFRDLIDANRLDIAENEQSRVFACNLCLTFWTALLFDLVYASGYTGRSLVAFFAIWGVASLLDLWVHHE